MTADRYRHALERTWIAATALMGGGRLSDRIESAYLTLIPLKGSDLPTRAEAALAAVDDYFSQPPSDDSIEKFAADRQGLTFLNKGKLRPHKTRELLRHLQDFCAAVVFSRND